MMSDGFDTPNRSLRVRPYALTGGRTRAARDLPIETLVRSTVRGLSLASVLTLERKTIATMCAAPLSIAEISAHLHVPLGVARVLVGDMVADELLETNRPPVALPGDRPDIKLLERVLDGLHAL